MAKCSICNFRKGKRKCAADNIFVCSLCCGQSRTAEKCAGCSYYKDVSLIRNYRKVPFYSTQRMSDSSNLQDIANVIESILCQFDTEDENVFTDKQALKLLKLAFDRFHFGDTEIKIEDYELKAKFEKMCQIIQTDLSDTYHEEVTKVFASVYRSIQRRTQGGREYLSFIQQYVGIRVAPGVRALPNTFNG
ncbi:MAG: hypothetical protein ABIJ59_15200 [Pseudomonadota bacterium]